MRRGTELVQESRQERGDAREHETYHQLVDGLLIWKQATDLNRLWLKDEARADR
jgi:hypothetical protein